MKPDFATAATELKGKAILAAMDANSPQGRATAAQQGITGID